MKPLNTRRHRTINPVDTRLWRVVDGAVADALGSHPEYLTPAGAASARQSITKRVVGSLRGFAEQSARGLATREAGRGGAACNVPSPGGAGTESRPSRPRRSP